MGNVALLVLDTLRSDYFDEHFDWVEGTRFDRAYTTANWTIPAHASLFTGRYASSVGVDAKRQTLDCDRPVLAETLRSSGFRTRAISANHNVSAKGNWDRGFREFLSPSDLYFRDEDVLNWEEFLSTTDSAGARLYLEAARSCFTADCSTLASLRAGYHYYRSGLRAASTVDDFGAEVALELVREWEFDEDEFLYVNLMETHTPYDPPEGYPGPEEAINVDISHSLGLETPADDVERAYDGAARYLSDVTEAIYGELEADFDCVILLSDHGEMLGERGLYNHTYGLYPPVVEVPLVVSGPAVARERDSVTSLLDVYPTVLEVAGIEPPEGCDGVSLFDPSPPDRYLAEYRGLLDKAVRQLRAGDLDERTVDEYEADLVSVALPDGYVFETMDGVEVAGSVSGRPEELIATADRTLATEDATAAAPEATPDIPERQLEDLGYL